MCISFPLPDHDGFMHHPMHVLDAPVPRNFRPDGAYRAFHVLFPSATNLLSAFKEQVFKKFTVYRLSLIFQISAGFRDRRHFIHFIVIKMI